MIREATPADIPEILRLVHELVADYEREPDAVEATAEMYARYLFPEDGRPMAYVHLAQVDDHVAGMALWFPNFSTWTGRPGVWLEDLFVEPGHRGERLGLELMRSLARVCVERGWARLDWSVLTWNQPALDFYDRLGAERMTDWVTCRLSGQALTELAQGS